jgi:hypothetical protein
MEQPDLLCTAFALNIELLSIIVCAILETSYNMDNTILLYKYIAAICKHAIQLYIYYSYL